MKRNETSLLRTLAMTGGYHTVVVNRFNGYGTPGRGRKWFFSIDLARRPYNSVRSMACCNCDSV